MKLTRSTNRGVVDASCTATYQDGEHFESEANLDAGRHVLHGIRVQGLRSFANLAGHVDSGLVRDYTGFVGLVDQLPGALLG